MTITWDPSRSLGASRTPTGIPRWPIRAAARWPTAFAESTRRKQVSLAGRRGAEAIVLRRFGAQQIAHEEVPGAPNEIRLAAEGVGSIRHVDQVKFLVGGDQRIHHLRRNCRQRVFIKIAVREQQLALQPIGLLGKVNASPIDRKTGAARGTVRGICW